MLHLFSGKP
ncbi:hypothetical protein ECFRIK1997_1207, partial [Escherichia coli FRIK1997]